MSAVAEGAEFISVPADTAFNAAGDTANETGRLGQSRADTCDRDSRGVGESGVGGQNL
ncbi:MAG: hypothetical protein LBT53_08145 [Puniceicoccales bacterium]|nr:hypothetical protein [Puniceicoccales bacterium]